VNIVRNPIEFWKITSATGLIYLFILGQELLNWPILQFARVVSPIKYRDTYWVLADADCYREIGARIYGLESQTGCPGYIYGQPLLRFLNLIRIEAGDTEIFVHVVRALFSLALALVILQLAKKLSSASFLAVLALLSPGTQLMLYNGNFDLLIFAIVVFGYFAISKNFVILGLILFFISGVFKFYTIPLLLVMIFCVPKFRDKAISLILLLLASMSAVSDLRLMQESIPSSGYAQFGFSIYSKYLEQLGMNALSSYGLILSLFILIASFLVIKIFSKSTKQMEVEEDPNSWLLFLVLVVVFLACYFAGLSYDPRLLYLTLAGYYLATQLHPGPYRVFVYVILIWSSLMSTGIELGFIPEGQVDFHPLRFLQLSNDFTISLLTAGMCLQLIRALPNNSITDFSLRIKAPKKRNS
jgi:hypothetical protein